MKTIVITAAILLIMITGFSLKSKNEVKDPFKADIEHLEGRSEFFFKPENDSRTWHVINVYSSEISGDVPEYNNSTYVFTSDSVTVINEYVGVNSTDFIANK